MGYYTDYTLEASPFDLKKKLSDETIERIEEEIELMNVFENFSDFGSWYANAKWYDYDEDMCLPSSKFPDVLFTLHGQGEDPEDMWNAYYLDGAVQECRAIITFEEFSPDRLVRPTSLTDKYQYQS